MNKDAHFFTDDKGIVWAYEGPPLAVDQVPPPWRIRPVCIPTPDFASVVGASMLLYRTVAATETAMTTFIATLEEVGADQLVNAFQEIAANLNLAQRAAEEGMTKLFPPK